MHFDSFDEWETPTKSAFFPMARRDGCSRPLHAKTASQEYGSPSKNLLSMKIDFYLESPRTGCCYIGGHASA